MDLSELEHALIVGGHRGWYLAGGLLDDTCTLNRTAGGWEVYYSERGKKYDVRTFGTEDEACRYFLAWMNSNGSGKHGDNYKSSFV